MIVTFYKAGQAGIFCAPLDRILERRESELDATPSPENPVRFDRKKRPLHG